MLSAVTVNVSTQPTFTFSGTPTTALVTAVTPTGTVGKVQ